MKKLVGMLLTIALCLAMTVALADGVSLEEALAMVGQPDCPDLIELEDDLVQLDFLSTPSYSLNEGKFIVVLREAPQKKYETRSEAYPSDYCGKDDGEVKTYLYASIMKEMSEDDRALTVAEIGNVLMAESFYVIEAEISTTESTGDAERASDAVLQLILSGQTDEAEAMQEMQAEQEAEQVKIYKYTPVFAGIGAVNLYNWADCSSLNLYLEYYPAPEMRDNPEADDYWDMIIEIVGIAQYAYAGDIDGAAAYINDEANCLDEALLESMLSMDAETLYETCDAELWRCAALMAEADGDANTMAQYQQVIDARNLSGLAYIAQARNYNGVGYNDLSIQYSKLYTGEVDMDEVKTTMVDVAELMSSEEISWDAGILYFLLFMGV